METTDLCDLDYLYPKELIAVKPSTCFKALFIDCKSSESKIITNKKTVFEVFDPGDVLVFNQSYVLPRRLKSLENIDVVFVKELGEKLWQVLYPVKKTKVLHFQTHKLIRAELLEKGLPQTIKLTDKITDFDFEAYGLMALPPYLSKRRKKDLSEYKDHFWYQLDWACKELGRGSLAAPTASLHFTTKDLEFLKNKKKVKLAPLTLDVGLGTFLPLRTSLQKHRMPEERVLIPQSTLQTLYEKDRRACVWALGTTVVRALETYARSPYFKEKPCSFYETKTSLFLKPGDQFFMVNALMTNFHQPQSSLLALVQAFAGKKKVKEAYQKAIKNRFRLFSYGDLSIWKI